MPAKAPQRITYYVDQGTSASITAAFTLRGVSFAPSDLFWTLTDDGGVVINNRLRVPIPPLSSVTVVLTGADLQVIEAFDSLVRVLTLEGHYGSVLDGNGLSLAAQYYFGITRFPGWT